MGSHFQVVHVVAAFVNCVVERACFSVMSVLLFHYFIAEIQILLSNMLANSPPRHAVLAALSAAAFSYMNKVLCR